MIDYLLLLGFAVFAALGYVLLTYGFGWWPFDGPEDEWLRPDLPADEL